MVRGSRESPRDSHINLTRLKETKLQCQVDAWGNFSKCFCLQKTFHFESLIKYHRLMGTFRQAIEEAIRRHTLSDLERERWRMGLPALDEHSNRLPLKLQICLDKNIEKLSSRGGFVVLGEWAWVAGREEKKKRKSKTIKATANLLILTSGIS